MPISRCAAAVLVAGCQVPAVTFTPTNGVIEVTSSVMDGTYGSQAAIPILMRFRGPVDVAGTPQLRLDSGAAPAPYTAGSGTDTLTFTYAVVLGDSALDLDYASTDALLVDGASIASVDGGELDLALPAPGSPGSLASAKAIEIRTGRATFAHTGQLQTLTVPRGVTALEIDAAGAEGGTSTRESAGSPVAGGKGARAVGVFAVRGGEEITILVGAAGANGRCGSGGGGASWAVRGTELLLVAGGGGGGFHCNALGEVEGEGGRTVASGGDGRCTPARSPRPGAQDGLGGSSYYGGGGGGWLQAGVQTAQQGGGGGAYPGAGGALGGGFGGGGGYYVACCGGSGGGGGYSGGSGGTNDGCAGGGGGSFAGGLAASVTADTQPGDGRIIVTW